ncbi:aldo/keto reductase [endosymbiont GvMRE of Glomus versiforme]|uniref:aldo/keto reductase n=1 Tax=endosymbiont GvMRE of Glomus versiforme TaxID=2039283 RepID=UPI000EE2C375|nr:aldo/keto reductase [endosymbiont GvMRE of Glomus versiforme]RHZ37592.1 Aldo/keto reductase [endosymbiont GvMRE of Glomus versiforme]
MKRTKKIILLVSLLAVGILVVIILVNYCQKKPTSSLPKPQEPTDNSNNPKNNNMNILQKTIALSNGIIIPLFGLGSWNLTNYQRDKQAVQYALQREYRLIDSAQMHNNEKMIGQAVKDSGVPRQEVFLVSKLNTHQCEYNTAKKTIDQMLANFQTDYLDLCLIHWPVPQKRLEAWKAGLSGRQIKSDWGQQLWTETFRRIIG